MQPCRFIKCKREDVGLPSSVIGLVLGLTLLVTLLFRAQVRPKSMYCHHSIPGIWARVCQHSSNAIRYTLAMDENTNTHHLSRFQITLALLVMLAATVRMSLAAIAIEDDVRNFSHSIFFGGAGLLLLVTQYGGTFRSWKTGLLIATGLLYFVLLWSVIGMITLAIALIASPFDSNHLLLFLWSVPFAPLSYGAIQANQSWYRTLHSNHRHDDSIKQPSSFSLLDLLGATFVLASVIGPVSYRANTNQSLYLEDVTRAETPFAVSDSADGIRFRRERDGAIRAHWIESPAVIEQWVQQQKGRPEVVDFSIKKQEDVQAMKPVPQPRFGSFYSYMTFWEMNIASWKVDNRYYEVMWTPTKEPLLADVYFHESEVE